MSIDRYWVSVASVWVSKNLANQQLGAYILQLLNFHPSPLDSLIISHTLTTFLKSNFHSGTFFTALGGSSHLSSSLPPCMATLVIYFQVSGIILEPRVRNGENDLWSGALPKSLPSFLGGISLQISVSPQKFGHLMAKSFTVQSRHHKFVQLTNPRFTLVHLSQVSNIPKVSTWFVTCSRSQTASGDVLLP